MIWLINARLRAPAVIGPIKLGSTSGAGVTLFFRQFTKSTHIPLRSSALILRPRFCWPPVRSRATTAKKLTASALVIPRLRSSPASRIAARSWASAPSGSSPRICLRINSAWSMAASSSAIIRIAVTASSPPCPASCSAIIF